MKTAAICIATYRRPQGLQALLRSLANQQCPEGWNVEIRVVNNDANATDDWDTIVKQICPNARTYIERRRNIALARNTAVAMGWADAYLFIDDDEIASENWIDALLSRYDDADAVIGPVRGRPAQGTPAWLTRSGAFDKPGPDHDQRIDWTTARTSSASVRGDVFRYMNLWFNPAYGITGGSDAEFFKRLSERAGTIVHERRAHVAENIEKQRCNWKAVLARRYKAGVNFGKMTQEQPLNRWAKLIARCSYAATTTAVAAPAALLGHPDQCFRGLSRFATALGIFKSANQTYNVTRYPERTTKFPTGGQLCALSS